MAKFVVVTAMLAPLLASCNNSSDPAIDAVPAPSEQNAQRLMAEAQNAAANAQRRGQTDPRDPVPNTRQGETK